MKRKKVWQASLFVISMLMIIGAFLFGLEMIEKKQLQQYTVVEDINVIKNVEEARIQGDSLVISGWCFYKGVDSNNQKVRVFLRNLEDERDSMWLDAEPIIRDDVNRYFDCEYDYSRVGFEASVKLKKIDVYNKNYEILLCVEFTKEEEEEIKGVNTQVVNEYERVVSAKKYINKGIFSALKPDVEEPDRTASKEINEVISSGVLLGYNEQEDIYIYQFQRKIYWIAGERFSFEEDGTTLIQYQLETTRNDKLPLERLNNGWYWDNIGFVFEDNEIGRNAGSVYRATVCDIPTAYPVSCFWTGYCVDDTWIWKEYLCIDIREFN